MRYLLPANRRIRTSGSAVVFAILGSICLATAHARAADADVAEKSPAQLMPVSSAAYFEVIRPKDVIALLHDHPISKLIQQTPDFRKSTESAKFKEFLAAVGIVENRVGVKWRPALESITGGGVALCVDAQTQGAVLLIRSDDVKTRDSVRDTLMSLVRDDAKAQGRPDPIESKEYRGLAAYKAGDDWVGSFGKYLLISNKAESARAVADLCLDGGKSLADESIYTEARKLAAAHGNAARQAAWGFVRLDTLREMGIAKELLVPRANGDAKSDNVVGELLAGGVLSVLRKSPFVAASIDLSDPGNSGSQVAKIRLTSPSDPAWVPPEKQFFFAPGGGADDPLRPKDTVLSISTWRDLSALFQSAPDLFNEGVAGQIAQADSGISNFLGGKSFSHDILGALEPQIQFVAARQDYKAEGVAAPTIRLPAMALVFKVKDGKSKVIGRPSRLAYQTLLTFGNLAIAAKGRPTWESKRETRGNADILYASAEAPDAADEKPAKDSQEKIDNAKADEKSRMNNPKDDILDNFSPALVLSADHLMICSTRAIAEELADLTQGKGSPTARGDNTEPANTRIEASGSVVAALLRANREQLIARNMLSKGRDRQASEKEIDLLINLVDCVKDANIHLDQTTKSVRLELEIKTATP